MRIISTTALCVTALGLAGALGGCRGPGITYRRPDLAVPAQHRGADVMGPGSVAPIQATEQTWWAVFEDPALVALVREALANNQDLDLAAARVEESRALAGLARSEGMPQLDVEAGLGRRGLSQSGSAFPLSNRNRTDMRAALGATWELDLWGRVRRSTEAAWADYVASEHGRRAVLVALIGDVAQAYVELLALDWQLAVSLETVTARASTRDLFQKRLEGGVGSELEVARASGDLAGVLADVPAFRALVALKEHQISLLLGRMPGPIARGAPLDASRVAPTVPVGLPSTLLERRPDVRAAEDRLRAAIARVGVAKAEFMPRISLTAALGLESSELSNLGSTDAAAWSVAGSLLAPLFSGGRLEANEQAAWARAKQAEAEFVRAAQGAFRDVADALALVRHTRDVASAQNEQVAARRRGLELVGKRFQGDLASYFEVLDAQRELFPAQLLLASAKREELLAVVRLYRALGGGWDADLACRPPCERPSSAVPCTSCGPCSICPPGTRDPAPLCPVEKPCAPAPATALPRCPPVPDASSR
jgi:outer membrane protein, multidrug efflux system